MPCCFASVADGLGLVGWTGGRSLWGCERGERRLLRTGAVRLVLLELVVLVHAIMVLGDVRIRSVVLLPHIMTVYAPFAVTAFCAFYAVSASAVKY